MEDLTGKQLGRYQVVWPLGEGGMAVVYKAYQPGMDRYVALKVLPEQYARDPEFTGRFEQEARMIAKLQHPHVLPVHDYGSADSYTYIVMPLVETGTLADLLRPKTPLSLQRIRIIMTQIGDALDYAHSQGLIHRDVKPSNVLIDKRGNCLLTDFGIAKLVEGTSHFTETGGIVGTPHYMSPEQGSGEKLTPLSDIYALGVMLFEMVTGQVPFDATTPMAVVIKHMTDPLPPPSKLNPDTSPALESVIIKSMAKRPEDRYDSAAAMVRAVRLAIPESAVVHEPSQVGTVPTEDLAEAEAAARGSSVELPSQDMPEVKQEGRRLAPWLIGIGAIGALLLCGAGALGIVQLASSVGSAAATESAAGTAAVKAAVVGTATAAARLPNVVATAPPAATGQPAAEVDLGGRRRAILRDSAPSDLPSARWPVTISDTLDANVNQWSPFSNYTDEFGERTFIFGDGVYRWDILPARNFSVHDTPEMSLVSDFALTVDVHQVAGPENADYGVVFNETAADMFYNFSISDTNHYALQLNEGGTWTSLLDWTASAAIRPGEVNRLTVVAEGGRFTFFVNNQFVDEISDDTLPRGRVGMVVNVFDSGVQSSWEFDNFEIREPWTAAVVDAFDVVSRFWETGPTTNADFTENLAIEGGTFNWILNCEAAEFGCRTSSNLDGLTNATDFELTVDILRVEGPLDSDYGVRFRDDGENYLEFTISDLGYFDVLLWHGQELELYYSNAPAPQIEPGGLNRLTVSAQGPSFAFYINGIQVGQIVEELLPAGAFALSAAVNGADQALFQFDNFKVRTP